MIFHRLMKIIDQFNYFINYSTYIISECTTNKQITILTYTTNSTNYKFKKNTNYKWNEQVKSKIYY